jgi:TrpR-related protein YerC/YecD
MPLSTNWEDFEMQKIRSKSIDRLFETILNLETVEDCYDFFEDVCTIKELLDMAQRMDAAFLLDEGANYQTIVQETGLSTATISRVSKCLKYGTGYRQAIDKVKENTEQ